MQVSTENALQLTITKSSLVLAKALYGSYVGKGAGPDEEGAEEVDAPAPETFEPAYAITNMVRSVGAETMEGGHMVS